MAAACHGCAILRNQFFSRHVLDRQPCRLIFLDLKFFAQGLNPGFQRFAPAYTVALPAFGFLLASQRGGLFTRLLRQSRRPGEHTFRPYIYVQQIDPLRGEQELAQLVGMCHAPRFEHIQGAVALAQRVQYRA